MSAVASRVVSNPAARASPGPRVVISNGLNRFHLSVAAAEVARSERLALMLTGGYPTRCVAGLLGALGVAGRPSMARLIDRGDEIPENLVQPLWGPELLGQLGSAARNAGRQKVAELLDDAALRAFARGAARRLRRCASGAEIYHYRSGFGLASVGWAKGEGLVALCDHSIVHPLSLGRLLSGPSDRLARPWTTVLRDLEHADHVLVNSDFVKSTFVEHGWEPERVRVIYLGVDDAFLESVPSPRAKRDGTTALSLLFAGTFEPRKGVDALVEALSGLDDVQWTLQVAGGLPAASRDAFRRFFDDSRVSFLGTLPRRRLARVMAENDALVFPSLAEGSARVVFEALACGLYVITTPNAGSIVEDGVHGALVPPRSPEALANAIRSVAEDRSMLDGVGCRNAALVRSSYRQRDYGNALVSLYDQLKQERS